MSMGYTPLTLKYLCMYNVQKVLPAVYDDSLSYYELLAKIQAKMNEVIVSENNLNEWQQAQDEVIALLEERVNDFIDGGYRDEFDRFVRQWLEDNFEGYLDTWVHMIFFGLTDNGHFCAYVPRTWHDIEFDTGAVFGRSDYGRLILRMRVNGEGVIDNTYSYSLNAEPTTIESLIRDLEITTLRGDASYYTLFTNMSEEVPNGNF